MADSFERQIAEALLGGTSRVIQVTCTLDTNAYASGDVIADTQEIPNAVLAYGGGGVLQEVTLIDQDDQKVALKVIVMQTNVSLGTENSAPNISDANALNVLTVIDIAAGDYLDLGGVSVANIPGLARVVQAAGESKSLYFAIMNGTGTPTYTGSGLKVGFGFV